MDTYLRELVDDATGECAYSCSDTSYCGKRQDGRGL
jgi:alpha-D-ribose 1-methylphosphonate 5-phosphate C-P lyase